jgi:RimJ/RimL family protein N-acetyltransferase
MFPDLLRDDVFRLETRRLWLRWPRAADAEAIATLAGAREVAEQTAHIPHPYPPGAAAEFILRARAGNLGGESLTLVLALKGRPSDAIGCVSLQGVGEGALELGYWLGGPWQGRGLMAEAVDGLTRLVVDVCDVDVIRANAAMANVASRALLARCGFVDRGEGMVAAPARGEDRPVRRFELSRAAMRSPAGHFGEQARRCA